MTQKITQKQGYKRNMSQTKTKKRLHFNVAMASYCGQTWPSRIL